MGLIRRDGNRGLALLLLLLPRSVRAGEYGLNVDPALQECRNALSHTLNVCPPSAVLEDLRAHFVVGEPFRIKAVEMAVLSGRISFLNTSDLGPFSDLIVELCIAPDLHDFPLLLRFLAYLPYSTLRSRLEGAYANAMNEQAKSRLQEALNALPDVRPSNTPGRQARRRLK